MKFLKGNNKMSKFQLDGFYHVKKEKRYRWPCDSEPDRTTIIFPLDMLSKESDGIYNKQNGIYMSGILIPDSDVIFDAEVNKMVI